MVCTILTASFLMLAPVQGEQKMNSIGYFDKAIQVTERVLDRTICQDIERVQAVDTTNFSKYNEKQQEILRAKAEERKKAQREAMERHCRASTRVTGKNILECNLN